MMKSNHEKGRVPLINHHQATPSLIINTLIIVGLLLTITTVTVQSLPQPEVNNNNNPLSGALNGINLWNWIKGVANNLRQMEDGRDHLKTTTPDWDELCVELCRLNEGGPLCDCYIPPVF